jgi:dihydroorotase
VSSLFFKSGRVIDPANGIDGLLDLLVCDGVVEALDDPGAITPPADATIIDAAGMWIVPGLIDPHVHLRDPGFPEKETISSGLRAAAAGGFTTVAAMANTSPVNDVPEITRYMLDRAREVRAARLVPVSAVTKNLAGKSLVDFEAMVDAGARLFSDDGIPIDDLSLLTGALDVTRSLGFAISLHEEDRGLSCNGAVNAGEVSKRLGVTGYSDSAESARVRRDLSVALGAGAPVHVAHVSTADSIALIRAARRNGAQVSCEVTPHHFALDESAVLTWGPNAKMNPPLRARRNVEALHEAIADGAIDMIATDHAPHDLHSKQMDHLAGLFGPDTPTPHLTHDLAETFGHSANGVVGLETALGLAMELVHRGIVGASRMVQMMTINPARLLRLDRGSLAVGDTADITLIDPDAEWTVEPERFLSKSRNTPFSGRRLRGRAILTIVDGAIVFDGRKQTL